MDFSGKSPANRNEEEMLSLSSIGVRSDFLRARRVFRPSYLARVIVLRSK
jgi:hypothetical protein